MENAECSEGNQSNNITKQFHWLYNTNLLCFRYKSNNQVVDFKAKGMSGYGA
jgi:hypothetical protein